MPVDERQHDSDLLAALLPNDLITQPELWRFGPVVAFLHQVPLRQVLWRLAGGESVGESEDSGKINHAEDEEGSEETLEGEASRVAVVLGRARLLPSLNGAPGPFPLTGQKQGRTKAGQDASYR